MGEIIRPAAFEQKTEEQLQAQSRKNPMVLINDFLAYRIRQDGKTLDSFHPGDSDIVFSTSTPTAAEKILIMRCFDLEARLVNIVKKYEPENALDHYLTYNDVRDQFPKELHISLPPVGTK